MKKIIKSLIISLLIIQLMSLNVLAASRNLQKPASLQTRSSLLPKNRDKAKASERAVERGDFFVGADVVISNQGNGDIGGIGTAYLAVPVEEVYITLYLDRYDEEDGAWYQVTYYDAEFYAKDYPDGLNYPSVNITFKNQKKGYYRIRGAFSAVKDNKFEGFSPVTDGIWIE